MSRKKLSTWAKEQGVHYRTALAWVRAGKIPVPVERTPGGHLRVLDEPPAAENGRTVLYGRVSSSDQKEELGRQTDRLRGFAAGRGLSEVEVVEEIGSGLNGKRPRLLRVLADPKVRRIVVEHRDRLARFGVEYCVEYLARGRSRRSGPGGSRRRGGRAKARSGAGLCGRRDLDVRPHLRAPGRQAPSPACLGCR